MVSFLIIVRLPHLLFQHSAHEPGNGSVLFGRLLLLQHGTSVILTP
jgi:hypothetical protein